MPHVLHDVSVRLTTLEQRTKQLSENLKDHDQRHENRTAALAEAIATVNQKVSRTNKALTADTPKAQAKAMNEVRVTLRHMEKTQTQDRTRRNDLSDTGSGPN